MTPPRSQRGGVIALMCLSAFGVVRSESHATPNPLSHRPRI